MFTRQDANLAALQQQLNLTIGNLQQLSNQIAMILTSQQQFQQYPFAPPYPNPNYSFGNFYNPSSFFQSQQPFNANPQASHTHTFYQQSPDSVSVYNFQIGVPAVMDKAPPVGITYQQLSSNRGLPTIKNIKKVFDNTPDLLSFICGLPNKLLKSSDGTEALRTLSEITATNTAVFLSTLKVSQLFVIYFFTVEDAEGVGIILEPLVNSDKIIKEDSNIAHVLHTLPVVTKIGIQPILSSKSIVVLDAVMV